MVRNRCYAPGRKAGNQTNQRFNILVRKDAAVGIVNSIYPDQGPVVQSIVNLTTSLRRQLVKYMLTKLSNTLLFFVGKL